MKILQILALILGLAIGAYSQNSQTLFTISGTVYDANKAVIPKTIITFRYYDGQVFKTESFPDGTYKLKIPLGKYTIEFQHYGFRILKITNFENFSLLEKTLNANLEVRFCDDCNGDLLGINNDDKRKSIEIDFSKLKVEKNAAIVSGVITDEYGAVIPEIFIKFINEKSEEFKIKSNLDGEYSVKLPFGIYQVFAQLNDYWKNKEIKIEVKKSEYIQQNIFLICTAKNKEKCSVK